ncbi:MAG: hypothetical protein Q8M47_10415, partial [Devosia sp.]|nr:hypothetical protein [Devosia sp.]
LGGSDTIRDRLSVLGTKGHVKFIKDASAFGLAPPRSKFGYLVIEGMQFGPAQESVDPETGEVTTAIRQVLPSHFKCPKTGACLPVENPSVWVYPDVEEGA